MPDIDHVSVAAGRLRIWSHRFRRAATFPEPEAEPNSDWIEWRLDSEGRPIPPPNPIAQPYEYVEWLRWRQGAADA